MSSVPGSVVVKRGSRQRSRVTNRSSMFVTGDGDNRSPWARRFRDLLMLHSADLGGVDALTEAQSSLIRRVATIEVRLELMEGAMSAGEDVDLDLFTRAASHLRRLLETLGIERRVPKDITPPLADYSGTVGPFASRKPARKPKTGAVTIEGTTAA